MIVQLSLTSMYVCIYIYLHIDAFLHALMEIENMAELFIHSSSLFIIATRIRRNDCIIDSRE